MLLLTHALTKRHLDYHLSLGRFKGLPESIASNPNDYHATDSLQDGIAWGVLLFMHNRYSHGSGHSNIKLTSH